MDWKDRYDQGVFAMLNGPWPRVSTGGDRLADLEAAVAAGRAASTDLAVAIDRVAAEAVTAQVEAGLGLLTDGSVRWPDPARAVSEALRQGDAGPGGMLVRAWCATAALTGTPVAQPIPGPWTLATGEGVAAGNPRRVASRAVELADALAGELAALAAAGCPVVQVMEPEVVGIGEDTAARDGFRLAQRRLLALAPDLHAMLAITGGSAHATGAPTVFDAPYSSYLFDLIAGPDNWHLVRAAPADRGIICAVLRSGDGAEAWDQAPQLVWAARYAASAGARGLERVGIANASPLTGLDPAVARRALEALGRAATLAGMPVAEAVEAGLDPRTVNTLPKTAGVPAADKPG